MSQIIFRQINEDLPEGWVPGAHWYVEYHDDKTWVAPKGVLYVFVSGDHVIAEYVYVVESERRKGIATALLNAAQERWPGLGWTEAETESGAEFLQSLSISPGWAPPERNGEPSD